MSLLYTRNRGLSILFRKFYKTKFTNKPEFQQKSAASIPDGRFSGSQGAPGRPGPYTPLPRTPARWPGRLPRFPGVAPGCVLARPCPPTNTGQSTKHQRFSAPLFPDRAPVNAGPCAMLSNSVGPLPRPSVPYRNSSAPKEKSPARAPGHTVFAIPYAFLGALRRGRSGRGEAPEGPASP